MRWAFPHTNERIAIVVVTMVVSSSSLTGQEPNRRTRQQLPPADIDSALTDTLSRLERRLANVAINRFRDTLETAHLVSTDFTLRVGDAPERSIPRAIWGQPNNAYRIESLNEQLYAARRVTKDVAVVSFVLNQKATREGSDRSGVFYVVDVWKREDGNWKLIARYSTPRSKMLHR